VTGVTEVELSLSSGEHWQPGTQFDEGERSDRIEVISEQWRVLASIGEHWQPGTQ